MKRNKSKNILREVEEFELHHKILAFIIIMGLTILISRLIVQAWNPNPMIGGIELHHFDYGLVLLFLTTLLLLFGKKRYALYLVLAAISFGLILDDTFYSLETSVKVSMETIVYNSTLPATLILTMVVIFAILLINYFKNKKHKN